MKQRRPDTEGGFTLLELLIALTVTVIGVLGLLQLHTTTMEGTQLTSQLSEAQTFGREMMEDMRAMSMDQIETRYGPMPVTVVDNVSGRANQQYTRVATLQPTSISPDLIRMVVLVTWTEAGAVAGAEGGMYDHAITLELIRTRQEIF